MQEGTLCREVIHIAEAAARANGLTRITRITIIIGINSCVHESVLQFHFEIARKGTMAEEAELVVEVNPSLKDVHAEYVKTIEGD